MRIPNILDFNDYGPFLQNLLLQNKGTRGFSSRTFAERLKWPRSLLHDIISGRKKLSIERAFELGKTLNFDLSEIEYLVLLSAKKSEVESVADLASEIANNRFDPLRDTKSDLSAADSQSIETLALLEYIDLTDKLPSFAEIAHALPTIEFTSEKFDGLVNDLRRAGAIKTGKLGATVVNWKKLFLDEPTAGQIHSLFQASFSKFLGSGSPQPRTLNSGFVKMTEKEMRLFSKKLLSLRNSLKLHEERSMKASATEVVQLWQFELSLFHLIRR